MVDVTRRTIYDWILRGLLHVWVLPNGRYLICERSLEAKVVVARGPFATI
jgi:hypothetical protein